ncbi:MAG: hypothetical protein M1840_008230 [Geoglossum simile]|nr:MAG: hypothetical protein M1840_008230 [Geoglossum simile]
MGPLAHTTASRRPSNFPRPSASILLLSPQNHILLLHRVTTSRSFPSAHVFPGGTLSPSDGEIPAPGDPARHVDNRAYRVGAIRECFEESGMLLAREGDGEGMLLVEKGERERGRRDVDGGLVGMEEWVKGRQGRVDVDNLIPFTRWITPANLPQRFTTQMYLYLLPLRTPASPLSPTGTDAQSPATNSSIDTLIPTPDGGREHTASLFLPPRDWLIKAQKREVILPLPQVYLLHLVSQFLTAATSIQSHETLQAQRDALLQFIDTPPKKGPGWRDICISPMLAGKARDGRTVMGLDYSGKEVEGQGRKGDLERVVVVRFEAEGPKDVEIKFKEEVELVGMDEAKL